MEKKRKEIRYLDKNRVVYKLQPLPFHTRDAPNSEVGNLIEGRRGKVKISKRTTLATISDGHSHALPLIGYLNFPVADRVFVGIYAIIARECVKQQVRYCSNIITVVIGDTACSKSGCIEGTLSVLDANQEAGESRATIATCWCGFVGGTVGSW